MKLRNSYFATMVIGNGLLAAAFQEFNDDDSVIIFASGVSNSQQNSAKAFEREKELLSKYFKSNAKLIYFSTISVYDASLKQSSYILHKLELEKLVAENCKAFIIFRLPILVGKTSNQNTLTNFLYNKIINGEEFLLYKNACRYLMDVDDVSNLLGNMILTKEFDEQVLDINFLNRIYTAELVKIFEQVLKTKANAIEVQKGNCYESKNSKFLNYLKKINFSVEEDYAEAVIGKYYSLIG